MTDNYQDLIDDYLRDRLSEEQRLEVERRGDADESFRAALDFSKQTKAAFAQQRHDQLKQRLQSLSSEASEPLNADHRPRRLGRSFWLVAASVLLICSIGFYMWSGKQDAGNPANLYAAYFEPYPNVVLPVTRNDTQLSERALAYSYYEQAAYADAYELFGRLPTSERDGDPETLFYRGISAMELGLHDEALALFNEYRNEGGEKLLRQASWYEALTQLKQENIAEARQLLRDLADHPGYKQTEAARILEQL